MYKKDDINEEINSKISEEYYNQINRRIQNR